MPPSNANDRRRALVIIPALNEEEALPDVLGELGAWIAPSDILVVDDGSTDKTAAVARKAGVATAQLPFHLGIGGALRTGFRYALREGFERAVQLDADGQHDPSQIPRLLEALDNGADMAVGNRFAEGESTYNVGRVRGAAMGALRVVIRILSGQKFWDTSSGYRAFSTPMLRFFAQSYPSDYLDSVESLLLACRAGFHVVEVPVRMRERASGIPSTRSTKLLYHYVRVLVGMCTTGRWIAQSKRDHAEKR